MPVRKRPASPATACCYRRLSLSRHVQTQRYHNAFGIAAAKAMLSSPCHFSPPNNAITHPTILLPQTNQYELMADPLSITASIVALVTVGAQIVQVVTLIVDSGKAAPIELVELEAELSAIQHILPRIREHCPEAKDPSLVSIDDDPKDGSLSKANAKVTDLDKTFANLSALLEETSRKLFAIDKLFRGGAIGKVKFSLTWSSARKDLKSLQARLERSKTSMLLSLQLLSL